MQLKAGTRLKSSVCETEVIVVKAPAEPAEVTCGGAAMIDPVGAGAPTGEPAADAAAGSQLGKRYVDEAETLELLVTKPGQGSLGAAGALLQVKEAKPLPASD